jgi:lactate/malate dehydrogenase, alpha/beta C-terminal domain
VQAKAGKVRVSVALAESVHVCKAGQTATLLLMVPPSCASCWPAAGTTRWVAVTHFLVLACIACGHPPSSHAQSGVQNLCWTLMRSLGTLTLQGSATLSMAYAGALFADACLRGLNGDSNVVEPTFVESKITELPFFASKVRLGPSGEAAQEDAALHTPCMYTVQQLCYTLHRTCEASLLATVRFSFDILHAQVRRRSTGWESSASTSRRASRYLATYSAALLSCASCELLLAMADRHSNELKLLAFLLCRRSFPS